MDEPITEAGYLETTPEEEEDAPAG